jgi:hypothetical protein
MENVEREFEPFRPHPLEPMRSEPELERPVEPMIERPAEPMKPQRFVPELEHPLEQMKQDQRRSSQMLANSEDLWTQPKPPSHGSLLAESHGSLLTESEGVSREELDASDPILAKLDNIAATLHAMHTHEDPPPPIQHRVLGAAQLGSRVAPVFLKPAPPPIALARVPERSRDVIAVPEIHFEHVPVHIPSTPLVQSAMMAEKSSYHVEAQVHNHVETRQSRLNRLFTEPEKEQVYKEASPNVRPRLSLARIVGDVVNSAAIST